MEYETLHDTLMEEPDDITVFLGHVTITNGSYYEDGSLGQPVATPLEEVQDRLDLVGLDRDGFVDRMVGNVPEKPSNYKTIIGINTGREEYLANGEATQLKTGANNCTA